MDRLVFVRGGSLKVANVGFLFLKGEELEVEHIKRRLPNHGCEESFGDFIREDHCGEAILPEPKLSHPNIILLLFYFFLTLPLSFGIILRQKLGEVELFLRSDRGQTCISEFLVLFGLLFHH
jgi:hypothetical protein